MFLPSKGKHARRIFGSKFLPVRWPLPARRKQNGETRLFAAASNVSERIRERNGKLGNLSDAGETLENILGSFDASEMKMRIMKPGNFDTWLRNNYARLADENVVTKSYIKLVGTVGYVVTKLSKLSQELRQFGGAKAK